MSPSMWAWRVFVPGLGLAASALILYRSTQAEPAGPSRPDPTAVSSPGPPRARAGEGRVVAEGRIAARPGAEIRIATEAGGELVAFYASEKAALKRGDLIAELRSDDLKAAVVEFEARLEEVDAEIAWARREYARRAALKPESEQFMTELDLSRRDFEMATARRKGVVAGLDRARTAVARARIVAPIDGVLVARLANVGELVPPLAHLATICDLDRTWVEAEVDEFDASRVAEGDAVTIRAEGSEGAEWPGTVESVPERVAERSARPQDPGRPTDARVLLVKIAPARPIPLKLGQQVEVEIRAGRPTGRNNRTGSRADFVPGPATGGR